MGGSGAIVAVAELGLQQVQQRRERGWRREERAEGDGEEVVGAGANSNANPNGW